MPDHFSDISPSPFIIVRPDTAAGPFVFSSPHSGRVYPDSFRRSSRLDELSLRRSEDSFVDELFAAVPGVGAPLISAIYPRAFVDLNREPYELDPLLFNEPLPPYAKTDSERVNAGLGTIARVVATGVAIYDGPIPLAEALDRIERVYKPYHAALEQLLAETRQRHGWCALIDCHSMPSPEAGGHRPCTPQSDADVVLGDLHGASCDSVLIDTVEDCLRQLGYSVARNLPYAGGFCTRAYGRPLAGMHALQIELNRALYMEESGFRRGPRFESVARDMAKLAERLARLELPSAKPLAAE